MGVRPLNSPDMPSFCIICLPVCIHPCDVDEEEEEVLLLLVVAFSAALVDCCTTRRIRNASMGHRNIEAAVPAMPPQSINLSIGDVMTEDGNIRNR